MQIKTKPETKAQLNLRTALRDVLHGFLAEVEDRVNKRLDDEKGALEQRVMKKLTKKHRLKLKLVHSTKGHATTPAPVVQRVNSKYIILPDKTKVKIEAAKHGWRRCFFEGKGRAKGRNHLWNVETEALALIPRGIGRVKHARCGWHGGEKKT